ncbi:hypothetical protein F511_21683 [Dorcoceras hygrometricum]|uniref:Uncharacterized protein n=1 Tax=Dorcoceras hygrometricum TaxID=472368 RepID=A0A2Z7CV70_9LAMI|nr:hypothetical protein F511_21683 [Dorcoceras hygrometricum]
MHMEQPITHENKDKRESPRLNNSLISHRGSKACYKFQKFSEICSTKIDHRQPTQRNMIPSTHERKEFILAQPMNEKAGPSCLI